MCGRECTTPAIFDLLFKAPETAGKVIIRQRAGSWACRLNRDMQGRQQEDRLKTSAGESGMKAKEQSSVCMGLREKTK